MTMKARDARVLYLAVFVLAFVAVFTCSFVIGVAAVTPFAVSKLSELLAKFKENHKEGMPAAKEAKAKLDELKKEQAQLAKDKKALEKKKLQVRKAQAKKLYEERLKNGYEDSLSSIEAYKNKVIAEEAAVDGKEKVETKKKSASKPKKAEKKAETQTAPAAPAAPAVPVSPVVIPEIDVAPSDEQPDYTANGSMFRGISF